MYLLEKEVILCIMIKNLVAYQKTSAIKLPNWDYYFVQMQMIYMMLKKNNDLVTTISSEQKKKKNFPPNNPRKSKPILS